jgi:hypothetical protein
MVAAAAAIPKAPFGPAPVDIDDTFLTISGQRYASASTKVRVMEKLETTLKLRSKLQADSPVRLVETYESASSESAGLFPVKLPALPYKRPVLVSYLDETLLVVRDASGRPDVLTRVSGEVTSADADIDDDIPYIPEVITEAEEKVEEVITGIATKVDEAAHKAERVAFFDVAAVEKLAGDERLAFFQRQADAMTDRVAFFKWQQDTLNKRVAHFEDRLLQFGATEARAFCEEKAEFFQKEAKATAERATSSQQEFDDTKRRLAFVRDPTLYEILEEKAIKLEQDTAAAKERAAFYQKEADNMKEGVKFFAEVATERAHAEAQTFVKERREYFAQQADTMSERAAFFQKEADALVDRADFFAGVAAADAAAAAEESAVADRAAFFDRAEFFNGAAAAEKPKKKKRRLFGFLRRKKVEDAAEIAAEVSEPIVEEVEKAAKGAENLARTKAVELGNTEDELKEQALQLNKALSERLAAEKKKLEASEHSAAWDQWREYAEKERGVGGAAIHKAEDAVESEEKRVEKAIKKKRGIFGFLRRTKGKDGKDAKAKAKKLTKKSRAHGKAATGRAAKRGFFGFLRRKPISPVESGDA